MKGELLGLQTVKTSLLKNQQLSELFNAEIFIKDESQQIGGTMKGRIAKQVVKDALENNVDRLVVFWLGNVANAITQIAPHYDIDVSIITQPNAPEKLRCQIEKHATMIDGIQLQKEFLSEKKMEDIARIGNEKVQAVLNPRPIAYREIINEISQKIKPDNIILPVGSGGLFFGVWQGLQSYGLNHTKIIGATLHKQNPLSTSCKEFTIIDDNKWLLNFQANSIADKLAQPYAGFEQEVNLLLRKGNSLVELKESEIRQAHKFVNQELRIASEPSASAAFAALPKLRFKPGQKVVVINTGSGVCDEFKK